MNLGLDQTKVKNKIKIDTHENDIINVCSNIEESARELYNLLKNNASKKSYSKIGKAEITVNGEKTEATCYELALKNDDIRKILSKAESEYLSYANLYVNNISQDAILEFSVKMYLKEKQLLKGEIVFQVTYNGAVDTYKIEKEANNLKITLKQPDKYNYLEANITKKGNIDSNEITYIGTISIDSEDINIKMDLDFDANFKFDQDLEIEKMTEENSVVLNEIEGTKILNILKVIMKKINDIDGIDESLLNAISELTLKKDLIQLSSKISNMAAQEEKIIEADSFNKRFNEYEGRINGANVKSLMTVVRYK